MHPWTEHTLQTFCQHRIAIEVLAEVWAGLFGMDKAHGNAFFNQTCQYSEERNSLLSLLNVEIFDVGCAYPKGSSDRKAPFEYFRIMVCI
jgi:hypothetical protein